MHMIQRATLAVAVFGLMACEGGVEAGAQIEPNSILYTYSAGTNSSGDCQPEREDLAHVGESGLFAVRGEAIYSMPSGDTEIPFQSVFKNPDEEGLDDDSAITLLNYGGACDALKIEIAIEYCEYYGDDGVQRKACPTIEVVGAEQFAAIELRRLDK